MQNLKAKDFQATQVTMKTLLFYSPESRIRIFPKSLFIIGLTWYCARIELVRFPNPIPVPSDFPKSGGDPVLDRTGSKATLLRFSLGIEPVSRQSLRITSIVSMKHRTI